MNILLRNTLFCGLLVCFSPVAMHPAMADGRADDPIANVDLESLDKHFHQFSDHFYPKLVRFDKYAKIDSISSLVETINHLRSENQPIAATAAIIKNLGLVERNTDTTAIIGISGMLLETNEWTTASQLYNKVKAQGDKSLASNIALTMAAYYFSRNQWDKTVSLLESVRSDLPAEDYYHALLMYGISLQHLQKHREALVQYAKIPNTSRYYAVARLNMAVANIRQDWWTDAHIIINDLIHGKNINSNGVSTDRLYTVLGYSLLQQQYFRNSRDAFRNVGLDGPYTNQALLGIALTAAYQEDYVGALNAIRLLKEKKIHDLPVDEANLLMPYFYEKLLQETTASAGYLDAVKYYENRVNSINGSLSVASDRIIRQLDGGNTTRVAVNDDVIDLSEKLPTFVFDNVHLLALYQAQVNRMGDATLLREYNALKDEHKNILHKAALAILKEKAAYLTHYMNQSRYGLARMQDTHATIPQ